MSTVLQTDGTVAAGFQASGLVGADPRRRRFGINPGIYQMQMEPRDSGRAEIILPRGLLTFRTATLAVENFDINVPEGQYVKQIPQDFTAAWFIANVKTRYEEYGFRELTSLTNLDDAIPETKTDKAGKTRIIPGKYVNNFYETAQGYYSAIHPSFSEIGHSCPFELNECVTCRIELLGDEEGPSEAIAGRMVKLPDQDVAERARLEDLESHKAYEQWCQWKWSVLVGELEKRRNSEPGIAHLEAPEHHVRKNIHEHEPKDQAALTAASFGQQVAEANAESSRELAAAFREGGKADNGDVLKSIVETQKQQGEVLAKLTEVLLESKKPSKKTE